jgi:hypothetical protein
VRSGNPATFAARPGYRGVKTFLKVLLILVLALIAIKMLPVTIALGCVLGLTLAVAAVLGVSLLAVLLGAALLAGALLTPVWLPVLMIVGLIALVKRVTRGTRATS